MDLNESNFPALEIEEIELDEDTATLIAISESQKDLEQIYPAKFLESFSQADLEPNTSSTSFVVLSEFPQAKNYYSDDDSQLKDALEDSPTQVINAIECM